MQNRNRFPRNIVRISSYLLFALALCALPARAGEFRSINPINRSGNLGLPAGLQQTLIQKFPFLERLRDEASRRAVELARTSVADIAKAWNTGALEDYLAEGFYDKTRFLDAVDTRVPRDAKLRVLAVEGVHPVNQTLALEPGGERLRFENRVSVTVRTQIEFNDPTRGFLRIEGVNDFILNIRQWIPMEPN